jgi:hypothetical protein
MQLRLKQIEQDGATESQVVQWNSTLGVWKPGRKNNVAAANPTVNSDSANGYEPGSIWVNTVTKNAFICTDASAGAAIWVGVGISGEPFQQSHVGDVITKPIGDTVLSWGPLYAPVSAASFNLFLNGALQRQGAGYDYTVTGATLQTITWLTASGTAMNMDASDIVTFEYETLGV